MFIRVSAFISGICANTGSEIPSGGMNVRYIKPFNGISQYHKFKCYNIKEISRIEMLSIQYNFNIGKYLSNML